MLIALIAVAALALSGGDNGDSVATAEDGGADTTGDDGAAADETATDTGADDGAVVADPTATPEPATPTAAPTATTPPPTPVPTPTTPPDELCNKDQAAWVCLTSVSVADGVIEATYDSEGFTASISSGLHYHFYGNFRTEDLAGSQGGAAADWVVWDQATFTNDFSNPKLSLDQSDKLCVVLGDANLGHQAVLGTGNCLPLP